jgi:hypothetical protein
VTDAVAVKCNIFLKKIKRGTKKDTEKKKVKEG